MPQAAESATRPHQREQGESDGPPPTLPDDLDHDRNDGQDDHDDDDEVNVISDIRDRPTEEIARPRHASHPSDAAGHIVEKEPAILHPAHAGDDRRECPDDRHESGDDDRLRPMPRVERPRPLDVARVEQERLRPREEPRAEADADRVADAVARDRGEDEEGVEPPDVEPARRRDKARRDQERIARKEEADEETGLGEDDPDEDEIAPPADQVVERVHPAEDAGEELHQTLFASRDRAYARRW